MTRPIDAEERAWALECLACGDTLADLAESSGRREAEWVAALGRLAKIPADISERLALLDLGLSQDEAGARLGVTRGAIQDTLRRARRLGLSIPHGRGGRTIPEAVREKIIALADAKVSYRVIAADLGVGERTVSRVAGPSRRDLHERIPVGRRFA